MRGTTEVVVMAKVDAVSYSPLLDPRKTADDSLMETT